MEKKTKTRPGPSLSIYLPDETKERLKKAAEACNMNMSQMACEAIELHADGLLHMERAGMAHPETHGAFQLLFASTAMYYRHGDKLPEELQAHFEAFQRALSDWLAGELSRVIMGAKMQMEN